MVIFSDEFWTPLWVVNTLLTFYVALHRRRSAATSQAQLIILLIFPVLDFIPYDFIGRGLPQENLFVINNQKYIGLDKVNKMAPRIPKGTGPTGTSKEVKILADHFNFKYDPPLSKNDKISFHTSGGEKFKALFSDINQTKETVDVECYSLMNDNLGDKFLNLLIKKTREGVKMRLIHGPWGSPGASEAWLKSLTDLGGEAAAFVMFQNTIEKYRTNYHPHRKIVVVNGQMSWAGGFNVDDQYVSKSKKFGYWCDAYLRTVGSTPLLFQERFVMDWSISVTNKNEIVPFNEKLFPKIEENKLTEDDVTAQIVSDGPDTSTPCLRNGMVRMVTMARKTLWIQTPYPVPDDLMIATQATAACSRVDVRIMIPSMPDYPFIHHATQWYANYLLHEEIKIYAYNSGFIYAKTVMVNERLSAASFMNQDFCSHSLSFETDAAFYDKNITRELNQIFGKDLTNCIELTLNIAGNWSHYLRFKQAFPRLSSPVL